MERIVRWSLVVALTALPAAVLASLAFSIAGAVASAMSIASWTAIMLRVSGAERVQRCVQRYDLAQDLCAANLAVAGSSCLAPAPFGTLLSPSIPLGMVALGVLSGGSFGAPSVATLYAVAMLTGAGIATLVGGLALALRGARAIAARVSA